MVIGESVQSGEEPMFSPMTGDRGDCSRKFAFANPVI